MNIGPMLNAYPDSMGGTLDDIAAFLQKPEMKDVFSSCYVLPSLFHTDLDRGFSVIDYSLNKMLASREALDKLEGLGIDLKLDFILNHASVLSKQFQDIIKNGDKSEYRDFFIDWNKFWEGCGEMTEDGYIQPDQKYKMSGNWICVRTLDLNLDFTEIRKQLDGIVEEYFEEADKFSESES